MVSGKVPAAGIPDAIPQFLTVITGTDQVHSVEFPKQLYLMIVHMLPVAGKSRHCDHFFPLFYGADDHTGSTMGNDHPAFPQLPGEAFSVQKPAVFIMLWLISLTPIWANTSSLIMPSSISRSIFCNNRLNWNF